MAKSLSFFEHKDPLHEIRVRTHAVEDHLNKTNEGFLTTLTKLPDAQAQKYVDYAGAIEEIRLERNTKQPVSSESSSNVSLMWQQPKPSLKDAPASSENHQTEEGNSDNFKLEK